MSLHTAIFCSFCSFLSYFIPSLSLIFPFSISPFLPLSFISFFHLISSINHFNLFYLSIYLSYTKVILFSFTITSPLREDLKSMYYSFFYFSSSILLGEKEGDEPVILTDILGLEDALGTMDFKGKLNSRFP